EAVRALRAELDLGSPVIHQYALAHFLLTSSYDKLLRWVRREHLRRHSALFESLAKAVPEIRVRGSSAGLDVSPVLAVDWARQQGLVAEPVGVMRAGEGPPAVVAGFARLPEHRAAETVRGLKVLMSGQMEI